MALKFIRSDIFQLKLNMCVCGGGRGRVYFKICNHPWNGTSM